MLNGLIVDDDGTQRWYRHGEYHRENGLPAIIRPDGSQSWWRHGKMHRENGPAVIDTDGSQEWYLDDQLHRDENDLPAIITAYGSQWWYRHGLLHRENGPAVIDGWQEWWRHGKWINVEKWIKDNHITTSWESWDETTWSLFRLEFL